MASPREGRGFVVTCGEEVLPMRPTLRRGSRVEDVAVLQEFLTRLGFDPGPVDGVFGGRTSRAVLDFQGASGLAADGVVGPKTWDALEQLSGSGVALHDSVSAGEESLSTVSTAVRVKNLESEATFADNIAVAVNGNRISATWTANTSSDVDRNFVDLWLIQQVVGDYQASGKTSPKHVKAGGQYSNTAVWDGLDDDRYTITVMLDANNPVPGVSDSVSAVIATSVAVRFANEPYWRPNDNWDGFVVNWSAEVAAAYNELPDDLPVNHHDDTVTLYRDDVVVDFRQVTVPSEPTVRYDAEVTIGDAIVPGRYAARVAVYESRGEVRYLYLDFADPETLPEPTPEASPPLFDFVSGPGWGGGAIYWTAANVGGSTAPRGSVSDLVTVEGEHGLHLQQYVALSEDVHPGGQYQAALVLGDLDSGHYLAQVTLALSGRSQGVAWEL
jgi:peptidoglycan hydrolase-like protein with peptidoglycan-binding domain